MELYVAGIGPGKIEGMTIQVHKALEQCDVIVGYTVYNELLKPYFPEKTFYATPMRQEMERCRWALIQAAEGKRVAVVCSGDAGIYGMAGLLLQLQKKLDLQKQVSICVLPGVTAASSGAALLGAPLSHDFAVISLSDLLTPLPQIWKRIRCAAMSDMVICLYNPASKKRAEYLRQACDIVLEYQSQETVCGYARNIGREGEMTRVLTLRELRMEKVDMFTTVYIGNSATQALCGQMVTPRGYLDA